MDRHRFFPRPPLLAAAALLLAAAASAADPPRPPRGALDPLRYRDAVVQGAAGLQRLEGVAMLLAIAQGSQMGPGEGWFHAGESRYSWEWLAARHGVRPDGAITQESFRGPAELFERLDRDRNGVLAADDFDWSERSPFLRQQALANQIFRMIDRNSNGRMSAAEWEDFFAKIAKDKEYLTPEDLRAALFPPAPRRDPTKPPTDGPSPGLLAAGLLSGELGSVFQGPKVGQEAPDFTLKTDDDKQAYSLAQFRGKPVVLVFGSFT